MNYYVSENNKKGNKISNRHSFKYEIKVTPCEASICENELFGYESTMDLFKSVATDSAKRIIAKMIKYGRDWADNIKPDDDKTMMAIRIQ